MFTVNHDEAFEGGLVEKGEYEVVVAKAFENATKGGAVFMDIQLVIRNDLDQKHGGQYLFYKLWQTKATGEYHSGMINTLAKALKLPNGKQYSSVEEILNDMLYKTARVNVGHEEYEGKDYARVNGWNQTKFPQCNHQWKDGQPPANGKQDDDGFGNVDGFHPVSDEDIPF